MPRPVLAILLTMLTFALASAPGHASDVQITVAVIAKSMNNPVFPTAHKGAQDAAVALNKEFAGKATFTVQILTPPEESGEEQARRINQAVNNGANVILISCSDAAKVTHAINDAVDNGVEVMTFDSDAPASKRFAFYGADDASAGTAVMAEMATQLGGKGTVAILAGNQNAPNLQLRASAVRTEAAKYPGISVVDTVFHQESPQEATKAVQNFMGAHPDLSGWVMVGGWPLFATALLNDPAMAKTKIVAIDALPVELQYIEKGLAPALFAQPTYLWGYQSMRIIADKLVLKKDVPVINRMDLVPVRQDNLKAWAKQLKDWGFDDVPDHLLAP